MSETSIVCKTQIPVEWADCDEAGIVFYPNYLVWFDTAFQRLLRLGGFDQRGLREEFNIIGTPIIEVNASFLGPATYGDVLDATAFVSRWGHTSFTIAHEVSKDGKPIVEGTEKRVWAERSEGEQTIVSARIPDAFRKRLTTSS